MTPQAVTVEAVGTELVSYESHSGITRTVPARVKLELDGALSDPTGFNWQNVCGMFLVMARFTRATIKQDPIELAELMALVLKEAEMIGGLCNEITRLQQEVETKAAVIQAEQLSKNPQ